MDRGETKDRKGRASRRFNMRAVESKQSLRPATPSSTYLLLGTSESGLLKAHRVRDLSAMFFAERCAWTKRGGRMGD